MPSTTSVPSGHVALELNGTVVGLLSSVEGGRISADVIEESTPGYVKKHLGGVSFGDLVLTAGFGMDTIFYRWLSDSLVAGKSGPKPAGGAIIRCDYDFKPIARRAFDHALISSVTFPKLDATSKDPAFLTVTISPEAIRDEKPRIDPVVQRSKPQRAAASNFRLEIDGLDCHRVLAVDALTVTLPRAPETIGITREPVASRHAGFSNLNVTLASTVAQDWRDHFKKFVLEGQNTEEDEKQGTLTLLTPDPTKAIATVNFEGLGIFGLEEDWSGAGAERMPRLTASFYCERFGLTVAAPEPTATAVRVPAA